MEVLNACGSLNAGVFIKLTLLLRYSNLAHDIPFFSNIQCFLVANMYKVRFTALGYIRHKANHFYQGNFMPPTTYKIVVVGGGGTIAALQYLLI